MGRRDKIIDEVIERYPNVGNRTLARLLVEQYPELYTIESARSAIRYRYGARGKKHEKAISPEMRQKKPHCTLMIPEGLKQVRPPVHYSQRGDWLVTGDWHVPYHDEVAIEAMMRFAVDQKISNLLLNGDGVDFYRLSDYVVDPRMSSPSNELELMHSILKGIRKHFRGKRVYKIGNHEDRYERYLYKRASAVVGIEAFQLDSVLKLNELKFDYIASKQHVIIGDMPIFHGHELPKSGGSPVNPAKSLYMRLGTAGVVSHHHYSSEHTAVEGLTKKIHRCFSIGCMCQMVKDYSPINGWNLGFGRARVDSKGVTQFRNYIVDRGRVECVV